MKRPFLVVDNFYANPDCVRTEALTRPYQQPENYSGWRTRPYHELGIKARIERTLSLPITSWPDDLDDIELGNGSFFQGFLTGKHADPVAVHFDTPAEFVTLVIYLTPGAPNGCGTSFWQHRDTKLLAMPTPTDAHRLSESIDQLMATLKRDSWRPEKWSETERVGNVYNRALFYRSGLMHSATRHFGSNLDDGRIYQTFRFSVDRKRVTRS
jgi:hypothetical protein